MVTIRHNEKMNGLEVAFDKKPPQAQLEFLKSLRFQWSNRNKVWYKTYSESLEKQIRDYFKDADVASAETPAPETGDRIYRKLKMDELHNAKRGPRKDVIITEIEAGKMEYATYKYFDGMDDSTRYNKVNNESFKPAEEAKRTYNNGETVNFLVDALQGAIGQSHYIYSANVDKNDELGYYINFKDYYIRYKDEKPHAENPVAEMTQHRDLYINGQNEVFKKDGVKIHSAASLDDAIAWIDQYYIDVSIARDRRDFGYHFNFLTKNEEALELLYKLDTVYGFKKFRSEEDFVNGVKMNFGDIEYLIFDNGGEFKMDNTTQGAYIAVIYFKDNTGKVKSIKQLAEDIYDAVQENLNEYLGDKKASPNEPYELHVGDAVQLTEDYLGAHIDTTGEVIETRIVNNEWVAKVFLGKKVSGERIEIDIPYGYLSKISKSSQPEGKEDLMVGDNVRVKVEYMGAAYGSIGEVLRIYEQDHTWVAKVFFGKNLSGQKLEKNIPLIYLERFVKSGDVFKSKTYYYYVRNVERKDSGATIHIIQVWSYGFNNDLGRFGFIRKDSSNMSWRDDLTESTITELKEFIAGIKWYIENTYQDLYTGKTESEAGKRRKLEGDNDEIMMWISAAVHKLESAPEESEKPAAPEAGVPMIRPANVPDAIDAFEYDLDGATIQYYLTNKKPGKDSITGDTRAVTIHNKVGDKYDNYYTGVDTVEEGRMFMDYLAKEIQGVKDLKRPVRFYYGKKYDGWAESTAKQEISKMDKDYDYKLIPFRGRLNGYYVKATLKTGYDTTSIKGSGSGYPIIKSVKKYHSSTISDAYDYVRKVQTYGYNVIFLDGKQWFGNAVNKDEAIKFAIKEMYPDLSPKGNESENIEEKALLAGKDAFHAGKKRIPSMDTNVMRLIENQKVGESSIVIFNAWYKGWDTENLKAPVPGWEETGAIKEAWEMTFEEFAKLKRKDQTAFSKTVDGGYVTFDVIAPYKSMVGNNSESESLFSVEYPLRDKADWEYAKHDLYKQIITRAIKDKKPIPESILRNYQGLRPAEANPAESAETMAVGLITGSAVDRVKEKGYTFEYGVMNEHTEDFLNGELSGHQVDALKESGITVLRGIRVPPETIKPVTPDPVEIAKAKAQALIMILKLKNKNKEIPAAPETKAMSAAPQLYVDQFVDLYNVYPDTLANKYNEVIADTPGLTIDDVYRMLTHNDIPNPDKFAIDFINELAAKGTKLKKPIDVEEGQIKLYPQYINPIKRKGIDSLKGIVSKDNSMLLKNPALAGVLIEGGRLIATDAWRMVVLKDDGSQRENERKVVDPNSGLILIFKFPDYKSVLEHANYDGKTKFINIEHLVAIVNSAVMSFKNVYKPMPMMVLDFNKIMFGVNPILLLEILQVLRANGTKSVSLGYDSEDAYKAIDINTDNGNFALVMPIQLGSRSLTTEGVNFEDFEKKFAGTAPAEPVEEAAEPESKPIEKKVIPVMTFDEFKAKRPKEVKVQMVSHTGKPESVTYYYGHNKYSGRFGWYNRSKSKHISEEEAYKQHIFNLTNPPAGPSFADAVKKAAESVGATVTYAEGGVIENGPTLFDSVETKVSYQNPLKFEEGGRIPVSQEWRGFYAKLKATNKKNLRSFAESLGAMNQYNEPIIRYLVKNSVPLIVIDHEELRRKTIFTLTPPPESAIFYCQYMFFPKQQKELINIFMSILPKSMIGLGSWAISMDISLKEAIETTLVHECIHGYLFKEGYMNATTFQNKVNLLRSQMGDYIKDHPDQFSRIQKDANRIINDPRSDVSELITYSFTWVSMHDMLNKVPLESGKTVWQELLAAVNEWDKKGILITYASKYGDVPPLTMAMSQAKFKIYHNEAVPAKIELAEGGIIEGPSHEKGGVKFIVKQTGQEVELEGGEAAIKKKVVRSKRKYEFEGKKQTPQQILNTLNTDGGGKPIQ